MSTAHPRLAAVLAPVLALVPVLACGLPYGVCARAQEAGAARAWAL